MFKEVINILYNRIVGIQASRYQTWCTGMLVPAALKPSAPAL